MCSQPTNHRRRHKTKWSRARAFPAAFLASIALASAAGAADPDQAATRQDTHAPKPGPLEALTIRASSEVSVYVDDDHVDVVSPTIAGAVENPTAGWTLDGRYLVDVVTAASADIIASASPPFSEVRHAGSLAGAYKPGDLGVGISGSLSVEPDYRAVTLGISGSLDLAQKNVSLFAAYAYGNDAAGRSDTPFAVFQRTLEKHSLTAAVTIVVNRSTIGTVSFDTIIERGDSSKPYRYVPLFPKGSADLVPPGADVNLVSASRLDMRPADAIPDSRDRFALTGRVARRFTSSTLRGEGRLYADTWGVKALTTEIRYRLDLGSAVAIWPLVRAHIQSGADFWERAYEVDLNDGSLQIPPIRTGDRELGPLRTLTGGAGLSLRFGPRVSADLQVHGVYTSFSDALYITDRWALFSALSVQAVLD